MSIAHHKPCPFCDIANGDTGGRILGQNKSAFYIEDGYPVSPGHRLIIPKRHIGSFFETTAEEKQDLFALLDIAKTEFAKKGVGHLLREQKGSDSFFQEPDGWNIGINDGPAAGQTVPHCHIHLIPRYEGDVKDPRGGVRWVVPEKAKYW